MKILKSLPEKEKSELPKLIKSLIDNDDRKNTLRKYFYIYRRNILEPLKPSDDKKKIEFFEEPDCRICNWKYSK